MSITAAIYLIILGGLCLHPLLVQRKHPAKDLTGLLQPYEVGLGIVGVIIGLITIVVTALDFMVLRWATWIWLLNIFTGVLEVLLGLLLGYQQIEELLRGKNPKLADLVSRLHERASHSRNILGATAIIIAVLSLLTPLMYP